MFVFALFPLPNLDLAPLPVALLHGIPCDDGIKGRMRILTLKDEAILLSIFCRFVGPLFELRPKVTGNVHQLHLDGQSSGPQVGRCFFRSKERKETPSKAFLFEVRGFLTISDVSF